MYDRGEASANLVVTLILTGEAISDVRTLGHMADARGGRHRRRRYGWRTLTRLASCGSLDRLERPPPLENPGQDYPMADICHMCCPA